MEVKPGYKQTEVGIIPEEWEMKPLRSVLSKGRLGGNYSNQDAEAELPLMKMGNIDRGYFDLSKVEFITPGVTPESSHRLSHGDVLFNTRNTLDLVGKVAIWRDELPVAYYNSNLMRLEFDPEEVCSNEYANYTLNTAGAVARLRALATGTTSVAAIYTRDLMGLQFVVAPKPEQRAIAEALSDVDALLGGLGQLIAKKRDLKQAAMQQLLTGQTRLPGFHGEWEVKRLGDVCRITTGKKDVNEGNPDGQFPFFTCSRSHTFSDSYSFDTEAILIAGNGEVGNLHYFKGKFEAYQRTYVLSEFAAHVRYLWQQLSAYLAGSLGLGKIGSSIPYIKKENLVDFEFKSPRDTSEQIAIAEVLSDMDTELVALEQRREKTLALKQAMMQQLLTGRTRLV
jgi:type I restriction enzyme, S subunit